MAPPTKTSVFCGRVSFLFLAAHLFGTPACQVVPPRYAAPGKLGVVRAETQDRALEVAALLDDVTPKVAACLPGSRLTKIEVWVQERLALYRFVNSAYDDADGFWAEAPGRIHLCERADNLERTLVHELVHASLDDAWRTLPGTLEEGLCDLISVRVASAGSARMRAGRLSSAAFVTGGLALELEIAVSPVSAGNAHPPSTRVRLKLDGDPPAEVDPLEVFTVRAGLSSTELSAERKRGLYGLSYVLVERIVDQRGIDGLYALCREAHTRGLRQVPTDWLLSAADLGRDAGEWRSAVHAALGPAELQELVRMHPEFMVQALVRFVDSCMLHPAPVDSPPWIEAWLTVPENGAALSLLALPEVGRGLMEYARADRTDLARAQ